MAIRLCCESCAKRLWLLAFAYLCCRCCCCCCRSVFYLLLPGVRKSTLVPQEACGFAGFLWRTARNSFELLPSCRYVLNIASSEALESTHGRSFGYRQDIRCDPERATPVAKLIPRCRLQTRAMSVQCEMLVERNLAYLLNPGTLLNLDRIEVCRR